MAKSDRRHRLLIYERVFAARRMPALLITVLLGVLAWFAPGALAEAYLRLVLVMGTAVALLLYLYTVVGPSLSYVQCRPTHLLVSTPFFRLAISYNRIYTTRPVPFDPLKVSWSQESVVQPFVGRTMLAMDLMGYPIARRWLRLLLNPFLLPDNFVGLQFVVADWMALSRDIEVHRSQWKARDRSRGDALTSMMK